MDVCDVKNHEEKRTTVRLAGTEDLERITELAEQLGYPSTVEETGRRLDQIQQDEDHAAFVAEGPDGRVVGWVHVHTRLLLVADQHAALGGLVVDESHRNQGIGRVLVEHAERWARERGCRTLQLYSNVIRDGARLFYEGMGYEHYKTSRAFRKEL